MEATEMWKENQLLHVVFGSPHMRGGLHVFILKHTSAHAVIMNAIALFWFRLHQCGSSVSDSIDTSSLERTGIPQIQRQSHPTNVTITSDNSPSGSHFISSYHNKQIHLNIELSEKHEKDRHLNTDSKQMALRMVPWPKTSAATPC